MATLTENEVMDSTNEASLSEVDESAKRRFLRTQYRTLITGVSEQTDPTISASQPVPTETLVKAQQLFSEVTKTPEAVLDSKLIYMVSTHGRQMANSLAMNLRSFSDSEFAYRLRTALNGGQTVCSTDAITPKMWSDLGKKVSANFKRVHPLRCVYGTFNEGEYVPKVKPARQANRNTDSSDKPATVPKQMTGMKDAQMHESTTSEVDRILSILRRTHAKLGGSPICFFEFVVNPNSFAATSENLFHVAFLVKDGHASVFLDDDGLPVIEPTTSGADGSNGVGGSRPSCDSTVIMSLSHDEWRQLVEVYHIQRPLIPPRKKTTN